MQTIAQALADAAATLATADSTVDAQVLLAHVRGCTRAYLRAFPELTLTPAERGTYDTLIRQRATGVPVAYLCQEREFWSLPLTVTPAVLVPRPDTETLVECSLTLLQGLATPQVLDLGTGSGAIGLALAHERGDASITLLDTCEAALKVALGNAAKLKLGNIKGVHSDWFSALTTTDTFDLIASNPPYLAQNDPHLCGDSLPHEPRLALVSGPTGLEALSLIIQLAYRHLRPNGWLALEHGAEQGPAVRQLLQTAGFLAIRTTRDLGGHERVTQGRANS